jgi:hypothetical protein
MVGPYALRADQVGDALGQYARFPGAGSGKDEDRSASGRDGLALGWVELVEEVHDGNM